MSTGEKLKMHKRKEALDNLRRRRKGIMVSGGMLVLEQTRTMSYVDSRARRKGCVLRQRKILVG